MPKFIYKAKQGPQKVIEGMIDAESMDSAVAKVMQAGYIPIEVKGREEKRENLAKRKATLSFFHFLNKIPSSEIVLLTRQLSDLIDAGLPLLQILTIVGAHTKHRKFKEIIEKMRVFVQEGGSLSGALLQFPSVFSQLYINMVKAGEVGGNLDITMHRLADFLEKDQETVSQIKTSLIYPSLIVLVGGLTIFALLTWVIPKITVIFDDLGTALPLPTRILIGMSAFLSKFWWLIIGLGCLAFFYLRRLSKTAAGKMWLDQSKLKIPVFGDLIKDAEIGRFARTLGTLLANGVIIVAAMEAVEGVVENSIFKEEIKSVGQSVSNGESMAGALRGKIFFTDAAVGMVAVAEESGKLHEGLMKLASYYERQTQKTVKRVLSLIEPVLILILGSVVGFVVIAMLMPMFKMNLIIQ